MDTAKLVAFISVTSLDSAERFYGHRLGLSLVDERPFALVASVGGAMLRITEAERVVAAPYTVLGWVVVDIDSVVDDLMSKGVVFTRYGGMTQDARGIWQAPSGSRVAWFLDPDGNNLSLTQFG